MTQTGENPPKPGRAGRDPQERQDSRDPELGDAPARVRHASVSERTLAISEMVAAVADPRCGAVVTFDGVVRNHDEGRSVERLEYHAHPSAPDVMAEVVAAIVARYPDVIVAAAHRVGVLQVGDSALVAAVAAPHRAHAFGACNELIEEIKARLPIWKDQVFEDGLHEWVGSLG